MTISIRGVLTVLLPGTGSDEDYLQRAFGGPIGEAGAILRAVAPEPDGLVAGYLRALHAAAGDGPIAVGGVSLGAAVAARWALDHPRDTVAVLAALPAWTGPPGDAPAAVSARHTATALRRDGLAATTAAMRSSSPAWLGDELARSWRRQWPALPHAMEEAAAYAAPTISELGRIHTPMAVVAATDDPIHPTDVAEEWVSAAPRAALRAVSLAEFGPRPAALGAACLAALARID
ncbi:alpha/beta fold hydrolase [Mycolicibacterium sp.]|uniref:alpha/beta fold hydrolase n=1 Tax=Mycolicibacterium sp. TaxID=2320850 RepID=UPI001D328DC5|nr:alpha/beta fold hydrolase [Mycolicibacterium sp.]MCB1290313.1 alpha/beta fold hydrolase [Mycobacterium sp.]MCB9408360.1 alpha/beta fold hydrolase [Mycolicibacterium sp.]